MKAQKNEMRQLTDSSRHTQVRCGTGQKVIGVTRGQLTRARIRVLQVGRREYVRRCRGQHWTVLCLSWFSGLLSKLQPRPVCYQTLETWLLQIQMYHKCEIHNGFLRLHRKEQTWKLSNHVNWFQVETMTSASCMDSRVTKGPAVGSDCSHQPLPRSQDAMSHFWREGPALPIFASCFLVME